MEQGTDRCYGTYGAVILLVYLDGLVCLGGDESAPALVEAQGEYTGLAVQGPRLHCSLHNTPTLLIFHGTFWLIRIGTEEKTPTFAARIQSCGHWWTTGARDVPVVAGSYSPSSSPRRIAIRCRRRTLARCPG